MSVGVMIATSVDNVIETAAGTIALWIDVAAVRCGVGPVYGGKGLRGSPFLHGGIGTPAVVQNTSRIASVEAAMAGNVAARRVHGRAAAGGRAGPAEQKGGRLLCGSIQGSGRGVPSGLSK